jgi:hypothetical protein
MSGGCRASLFCSLLGSGGSGRIPGLMMGHLNGTPGASGPSAKTRRSALVPDSPVLP